MYAKKYGNFLIDPLRFIKSPRKSLKAYKIESILKEVNKNFWLPNKYNQYKQITQNKTKSRPIWVRCLLTDTGTFRDADASKKKKVKYRYLRLR